MPGQQRARALIYGLALGDALGWPIEFLNRMEKVHALYGPQGIQDPPMPARVTDDTQTTAVIAEALIEAGKASTDVLMEVVVRRLIVWSNSPENTRAPGHTVIEAVRTLEAGVAWQEAGARAKGNGAAIRVAPIGYYFQHDPDRLREAARATSRATHNHPTAEAAAVAAAYLVKLALDEAPIDKYIQLTAQFVEGISAEFDAALNGLGQFINQPAEVFSLENVGDGWVAEEAVMMALCCAVRHHDDYPAAVRTAVNIPGDSDSVGCITGGIVAARLGLTGIPSTWIKRLEDERYLTDLADRLEAARERQYGVR